MTEGSESMVDDVSLDLVVKEEKVHKSKEKVVADSDSVAIDDEQTSKEKALIVRNPKSF